MKETLCIRIADPGDFSAVKHIVQHTIAEVYPHYYPKGVVEFFLEHHNDGAISADISKGMVYVVTAGDSITATVTLDKNEINRLFVLPEYQRHGYGTQILDWAEAQIFRTYETAELHASLPAKSLYLKRGYQPIEYRKIAVRYGDWLCIDILEKKVQP